MDAFYAFCDYFAEMGVSGNLIIFSTGLAFAAISGYFLIRTFLVPLIIKAILNVHKNWEEAINDSSPLGALPRVWFFLICYILFYTYSDVIPVIDRIVGAALVLNVCFLIAGVLNTVNAVYEQYPMADERPIKSYLQAASLIQYLLGGIVIISIVLDKDLTLLFSGFIGLAAAMMFIFRDTVMSFVAGIKIAAHNLIQKGDYIYVPSFDAEGDVIEVSLHVILVQNGDTSVVTIPTHKILECGFKNQRSPIKAKYRKMKRSVLINHSGIKFFTEKDFHNLLKNANIKKMLTDYNWNQEEQPTNLSIFRAYIESFVKLIPDISTDKLQIVRLLEPTSQGTPLEIIAFSPITSLKDFELLQASIFEHILAITHQFQLEIFQEPSSSDYKP